MFNLSFTIKQYLKYNPSTWTSNTAKDKEGFSLGQLQQELLLGHSNNQSIYISQ